VGHEIVGTVVKLGANVKHLKIGDRAGVGAQSGGCLKCPRCTHDQEAYCDEGEVGTYNSRYPDKSKSYGGYADYSRVPAHFVFKIPDAIPSDIAAPMLCGGVTVYSPLKYHGAGTTAKKVGIIGIGGLGHFGVLFAVALGAEVYAISHSDSKKEDVLKMGAKHFIATGNDPAAAFKPYFRELDLIVCTVNDESMPVAEYVKLVKPRTGKVIFVGAPENPISLNLFPLIVNGVTIGGSLIGSPVEIREMLDLAATQHIRSWVQNRSIKDANQAVLDMTAGKARYRYVLVNEKNL